MDLAVPEGADKGAVLLKHLFREERENIERARERRRLVILGGIEGGNGGRMEGSSISLRSGLGGDPPTLLCSPYIIHT